LKKTFVFTGGEIVKEFLLSTGYLPGAHDPDCPIYEQIAGMAPAWMRTSSGQPTTAEAATAEITPH